MIFAFAAIPVITAIGVAVDYARAAADRTLLQAAADVAALAATRQMDSKTQTDLQALSQKFLDAQIRGQFPASISAFNVDLAKRQVALTASGSVPTSLMSIVGKTSMAITAKATAVDAQGKVEVALALDNSGSMAGQRITDLRTAANALVTDLFSGTNAATRVKIGLVPFAAMVNVGAGNRSAAWMDANGLSPIASENFASTTKRFALYDGMKNVSWAGCVEARPQPYDIQDTAASTNTPATLFVPGFAPDEPDTGSPYYNNYLSDTGGSCTSAQNPYNESASSRQSKTCKYKNATPNTALSNGTILGPNHMCDTTAIQPLTNSKSTISTAINAMGARGGTNILEGLMWGWRVLSPGAPFTEGVAYNDPETRKILVLMTDGANQWLGLNNINHSWYSSFGFSVKNRLGTTSTSSSALKTAIDNRWKLACANVKAAGITVYTIAFDVDDATGKSILQSCASIPGNYYETSSSSDLTPIFNAIAGDIGKPRLIQ